jgi:hypothetical protein
MGYLHRRLPISKHFGFYRQEAESKQDHGSLDYRRVHGTHIDVYLYLQPCKDKPKKDRDRSTEER